MSRKITALRIDHHDGRLSLRALAKTGQGTQYTLRGVTLEDVADNPRAIKTALGEAVASILATPNQVG